MFAARRLTRNACLFDAAGGKGKGKGKGKKKVKLNIENYMDQMPDRYMELFPEDPMQPVHPKKISLQISTGVLYTVRNDRIEYMTLNTVEDGRMELHKNHRQEVWRVEPGLIKLHYSEDRVDKWYTGGGFLFNYYYGAAHLALISAFKLDELDIGLVQANLEKSRAGLKAKNEKRKVHSQLVGQFLEPLSEVLEESEYDFA